MFNTILIGLLVLGFLVGLKRGFILQFFHLVSFFVAFILAVMYYDKISPHLALWIPYPDLASDSSWAVFLRELPLENAFYNAVAFAFIFFATKVILQIIASMLDFVAELPVIHSLNKLLGAVLGFLEVYFILFIILFILALTPLAIVQDWLNSSPVALFMIEQTPYFSKKIYDLWFTIIESSIMNSI